MKALYLTVAFVLASIFASPAMACESADTLAAHYDRRPVERKKNVKPEQHQLVRVGNDTVSMVLPEKNYGRFDRGLFNYLYIPKGKWAFGLTASYGQLSTEDVQILSMLEDVNFKGHIYSIKPSVAYFFGNNHSIGLRLDYSRGMADLGSLALDIDDDMNFSLKDVSYYSQSYKVGSVYRAYVGLNDQKRFSVFNEVALEFGTSTSRFKRYYADELFDTRTTSTGVSLNFSPGLCVFIQDYVAFNVSFGVFGLKLNKEKQTTNGENDGSRLSSGANFKFNIFNINFGLMVVI